MVNTNVIQRLDMVARNSVLFFQGNQNVFENNVHRYLGLKRQIYGIDISTNEAFQRSFSYFYGLRFMPHEHKRLYYSLFEEIKGMRKMPDAYQLTERLFDATERHYFSFVTKMLNMLDDERYPIYDSHIEQVFRRDTGDRWGTTAYKYSLYNDVCDTYAVLRDSPIISQFRTLFHAEEMGTMKILDAIFWVGVE